MDGRKMTSESSGKNIYPEIEIPPQPCPRCEGKRESAYTLFIGDQEITVSEAYHLCEMHQEEWEAENEQSFF